VGLLIDRRGKVAWVMVGAPAEIMIPNLTRVRSGPGRLKGLRLVHTHLRNEPLSRDDLNDLAILRLDMIAAIGVGEDGQPKTVYMAHLNPDENAGLAWRLLEPEPFSGLDFPFGEFIRGLESELSRLDLRGAQTGAERAVLGLNFSKRYSPQTQRYTRKA